METERTRGREAIQNSLYEKVVKYYQAWVDRQSGKLLMRFDELEYQQTRQGLLKYYLSP